MRSTLFNAARVLPRPIRFRVQEVVVRIKMASHLPCILPSFLIIGFPKCGTTSLFNNLSEHPCIARGLRKEPAFFSSRFDRGLSWYKAHFPTKLQRFYHVELHRKQALITGEATPKYVYHPLAARRIHEIVPQAKIIALVRNPVDAVYSEYHFRARMRCADATTMSFEDAITSEIERMHCEKKQMHENSDGLDFRRYPYHLLKVSYMEALKPWFAVFPKERILIIKSEAYFTDPAAILEQVLDFLGLPNYVNGRMLNVHNAGKYSEQMTPKMKGYLKEYFRPYNKELYEYLNIDFGWDR